MLGNRASATGSKNSINGTTMKTEKGTRRKRSEAVRMNWRKGFLNYLKKIFPIMDFTCFLSLLVSVSPRIDFNRKRDEILTS